MEHRIHYTYLPDSVSPPGETLEEVLDERGMTQAELAERTGRSKKTINEIVQGKAALTPDMALLLERVLSIPAQFWLTREQQYREFVARQQDEVLLATHGNWLNEIPLQALVEAEWITARDSVASQVREALGFYGIASPAQYAALAVNFRRTKAFQSDHDAIVAWLRQGERLAQAISCAAFNEQAFRVTLGEVRRLTSAPFAEARASLRHYCATAGVAVVIVPELPQTRVCGAARWLSPTKALIQLSLRYKTDDQFWFTFFHEAGHLLIHGKRDAFLDEEEHADDEREREANRFAMDLLIPPDTLQRFYAQRGQRHISREMVETFAQEIGIAPGIVVGRLQYEQVLPRTHLNGLKRHLEAS